jgi:hypothetical protein
MASLWWQPREKILRGWNDYVMLYAGSRLAGSSDLYDQRRMIQVERETAGAGGEALQFTRPPYYAVVLWPLGRLPYRLSYAVWQLLSLAAVLAFVWLWPSGNRWPALWACSWSVPLAASFAQGQDCAFLMLWIALALRFYESRPFLAGLALSLCAPKFHLFLLLPILIVVQRRWRMAYGFLTGAGAMVAVSFLAGGWGWPMDYYQLLRSPKISPGINIMPNLHGLLAGVPHAIALEVAAGVLVAVAAGAAARRLGFPLALAATLAGGLLVSIHAYPADAVVLIPALLLILSGAQWSGLRAAACLLLTPVASVGLILGGTAIDLLRLALVFVVAAIALERSGKAGTPPDRALAVNRANG